MSGVLKRLVACLFSVVLVPPIAAQDLGALARFEGGTVRDHWGGTDVQLELSQGVPWRLFTLSAPNRLVMDFREVQWGDVDPDSLDTSDHISGLRVGAYRPGWSRLVADLAEPMVVDSAELVTGASDGGATLRVRLKRSDQTLFDSMAGAPRDPRWDLPEPAVVDVMPSRDPNRIRIVLDPGHGGAKIG